MPLFRVHFADGSATLLTAPNPDGARRQAARTHPHDPVTRVKLDRMAGDPLRGARRRLRRKDHR